MRRIEQASYGRREIEIAEQEMPGIMALRNKAKVRKHKVGETETEAYSEAVVVASTHSHSRDFPSLAFA